MIRNEHIIQLHCGSEALLAFVRNKYWPISGRNICRKTVYSCVRCFRAAPRHSRHIMGDLPAARVMPAPPFHISGVYFASPFLIKPRKGRGVKATKHYLCLFVCFATKALHLEVATDLSTECFIAAYRRFSARRGVPLHIYSDNGTNFIGANNELKELSTFINNQTNQSQIQNAIGQTGTTWHFIPPRSPHFGRLWEAGVKSVKTHLKRVVGNSLLTYEEFLTFLLQIEAMLNSRPLTPTQIAEC